MQTPDRYWEGLYWDGFEPELVEAVPLTDAIANDDSVVNMLEMTK